MSRKTVEMTFGLASKKEKANYYVPDGKGKRYATSSIVKAREYAVKMIEEHPKATSWSIYTSPNMFAKPHSGVVFYGKPAGYGWLYKSAAPRMIYEDGNIRLKADWYNRNDSRRN